MSFSLRRFASVSRVFLVAALIASTGTRGADAAANVVDPGASAPNVLGQEKTKADDSGLAETQQTLWREDQARVAQACSAAVDEHFWRLGALSSLSPPSAECLRAASSLHSALSAPWALSIARVHVESCFATPAPFDQQTPCARGGAVFGSVASFRGAGVAALSPFDALAQARSEEANALDIESPAPLPRIAALAKQAQEARSTCFFLALLSRAQVLSMVQTLRERAPLASAAQSLPAGSAGLEGAR